MPGDPAVSVIMPCKGRPEQTADLIPRLIATAGRVPWELICIVDDDAAVVQALAPFRQQARIIVLPERQGYWKALSIASQQARGRLLSNIANDVLPGLAWLERAAAVFDREFPDGLGVIGYNDGLLFEGHTGHILISRALAEQWYHAAHWPTMYDHLYGDTEICQRAMAAGRYAVALKAVLFHNHPVVGRQGDALYAFSHTHMPEDRALFERRKAELWTF